MPSRNFAEHGVHPIQVAGVLLVQNDEELTATRVFARMRHRQGSRFVRVRVSLGFALDGVAGAATSDAGGRTAAFSFVSGSPPCTTNPGITR